MELLSAAHVALDVAGVELFTDASLRLGLGDRVGLVGPNGSGKSSFLRVLAEQTPVRAGRVRRAPGVRVRLLAQSDALLPGPAVSDAVASAVAPARELEAGMRLLEQRLAFGQFEEQEYEALRHEFEQLGGYGAEARARELLAALGFGRRDLGRQVTELSAGERRRLGLALALADGADVLLLDEPTNHLDMAAREWLGRRLREHVGAVVVVSHDRALLDAATDRTEFVAGGRLWPEPGAYTTASRRRAKGVSADAKRRREHEREADRLERMARELASFGRKAAARKRRAERQSLALRVLAGARHEPNDGQPTLVSRGARLGPRPATLLTARHLSVPGVLDDVTVRLERCRRVALLGPNGSGKSTLLRLLAGDLSDAAPQATLEYLPGLKLRLIDQEGRGLAPGVPLLEQASAVASGGAAARLLAEAGLPQRAWALTPEQVSGGERARVGLAIAFTHSADVWLLDEPTNDLDLAAVEALEAQLQSALETSGAALVLATHDRRLAENLTNETWSLADGRVARYASVADFLRGAPTGAAAAAAGRAEAGPPPGQAAEAAEAQAREDVEAAARRAAHAEERTIAGLEDERSALLALLLDPVDQSGRDRERLRQRVRELEAELMGAYDARLTPPQPRYRVVERGLAVSGDRTLAGLHLALGADPALATLDVATVGGVAHLRLSEPAAACLLPWARAAIVDAGARLAFTVLGASAVQVQTDLPLASRWLAATDDGWHTADLARFLRAEGWTAPGPPRRRRGRRARGGHG